MATLDLDESVDVATRALWEYVRAGRDDMDTYDEAGIIEKHDAKEAFRAGLNAALPHLWTAFEIVANGALGQTRAKSFEIALKLYQETEAAHD